MIKYETLSLLFAKLEVRKISSDFTMFFFSGIDPKTVAKYIELRKLTDDRRKEEKRRAEQLLMAAKYFAPRLSVNKVSDDKLK